jgi:hypothetical protein
MAAFLVARPQLYGTDASRPFTRPGTSSRPTHLDLDPSIVTIVPDRRGFAGCCDTDDGEPADVVVIYT